MASPADSIRPFPDHPLRALASEQILARLERTPDNDTVKFLEGMQDIYVDNKGRFSIPAQYKAALGDDSVRLVAPPDGGGIWIFPVAEFVQLRSRAIEKLRSPHPSPEAVDLVTRLMNSTQELAIDTYGRITIPRPYITQSGLTAPGTNLLVGSGNFIEIKPIRPLKPSVD